MYIKRLSMIRLLYLISMFASYFSVYAPPAYGSCEEPNEAEYFKPYILNNIIDHFAYAQLGMQHLFDEIRNLKKDAIVVEQEATQINQAKFKVSWLKMHASLGAKEDASLTFPLSEDHKKWITDLENIIVPITYTASVIGLDQSPKDVSRSAAPATSVQQRLIAEAQRISDVKDKLLLLSDPRLPSGFTSEGLLVLGDTPDLNRTLFVLYHELGHIKHGDVQGYKGQDLSAIAQQADNYMHKARQGLNDSTTTGKQLLSMIETYGTFWIPTINDKAYLFERLSEFNSDFFSAEMLWKNNQEDVLLQIIHDLALFELWNTGRRRAVAREGESDVHPSDIERALALAGFLIEKGVDINKALQEWEATGICPAYEQAPPASYEKIMPENKATRDFIRYVYSAGYRRYWKVSMESRWHYQGIKTTSDKIRQLIAAIHDIVHNPPSEYFKTELLYHYNLLRELSNKPPADIPAEIDYKWLEELMEAWQPAYSRLIKFAQASLGWFFDYIQWYRKHDQGSSSLN